jgi:hypothetical protein
MTPQVRAAIDEVDPAQPVYHVATLDRLRQDALLPSASGPCEWTPVVASRTE